MTYQNLGFWIGQANDLSTGAHPTGWSNGQRWSETSSEWQAMYNAMVAERDAWIGNYNAAIASRDYWQHTVAHNDANVWDNRYNAGRQSVYNVLNNPDAYYTNSVGWSTDNQGQNHIFTFPRTGHYQVHVVATFAGTSDQGSGHQDIHVTGTSGAYYYRQVPISGGGFMEVQFTAPLHGTYSNGSTLTCGLAQYGMHGNYTVATYAHFISDGTNHN